MMGIEGAEEVVGETRSPGEMFEAAAGGILMMVDDASDGEGPKELLGPVERVGKRRR